MAQDKRLQSITLDQPGIYRIKIQGRLSQRLQKRFDDMTITEESNLANVPFTYLTGKIADQAALHGFMARIRDLGLPLILVELVNPVDSGE